MTPDQYVNVTINRYRSMYLRPSNIADCAVMQIFDQLLNVGGNGIGSHTSFMEEITFSSKDDDCIDFIKNNEPLYKGQMLQSSLAGAPHKSLYQLNYIRECEKSKYPAVIEWEEQEVDTKLFNISKSYSDYYPNFEERYSVAWKIDFSKLGSIKVLWIDAIIGFYRSAEEYFTGDCDDYIRAFPCINPQKTTNELNSFISRYATRSDDYISSSYRLEYSGDPHEFLCRKWDTQRYEFIMFCRRTIEMLEGKKHEE